MQEECIVHADFISYGAYNVNTASVKIINSNRLRRGRRLGIHTIPCKARTIASRRKEDPGGAQSMKKILTGRRRKLYPSQHIRLRSAHTPRNAAIATVSCPLHAASVAAVGTLRKSVLKPFIHSGCASAVPRSLQRPCQWHEGSGVRMQVTDISMVKAPTVILETR